MNRAKQNEKSDREQGVIEIDDDSDSSNSSDDVVIVDDDDDVEFVKSVKVSRAKSVDRPITMNQAPPATARIDRYTTFPMNSRQGKLIPTNVQSSSVSHTIHSSKAYYNVAPTNTSIPQHRKSAPSIPLSSSSRTAQRYTNNKSSINKPISVNTQRLSIGHRMNMLNGTHPDNSIVIDSDSDDDKKMPARPSHANTAMATYGSRNVGMRTASIPPSPLVSLKRKINHTDHTDRPTENWRDIVETTSYPNNFRINKEARRLQRILKNRHSPVIKNCRSTVINILDDPDTSNDDDCEELFKPIVFKKQARKTESSTGSCVGLPVPAGKLHENQKHSEQPAGQSTQQMDSRKMIPPSNRTNPTLNSVSVEGRKDEVVIANLTEDKGNQEMFIADMNEDKGNQEMVSMMDEIASSIDAPATSLCIESSRKEDHMKIPEKSDVVSTDSILPDMRNHFGAKTDGEVVPDRVVLVDHVNQKMEFPSDKPVTSLNIESTNDDDHEMKIDGGVNVHQADEVHQEMVDEVASLSAMDIVSKMVDEDKKTSLKSDDSDTTGIVPEVSSCLEENTDGALTVDQLDKMNHEMDITLDKVASPSDDLLTSLDVASASGVHNMTSAKSYDVDSQSVTEESTISQTIREIQLEVAATIELNQSKCETPFLNENSDDESTCSEESDEKDLPAWMTFVPHLSRKYTDIKSKLPVWEFTVHGGDDSVLYTFRTFVAPSKIPGAGLGAFIEFIGARRLMESSQQRVAELVRELEPYTSITMQPLQAYPVKGESGYTVHLHGENLHGNDNRPYKLRKKTSDLVLKYNSLYIKENGVVHPIGYHNLYTDNDYKADTKVTEFFVDENCIDLGRYGPFRKKDRKPEDYFVLKSFLFSQIPSEWGFAAAESLNDIQQMIDITDDLTGQPSDLARREIPIYVNEVGFNETSKRNVWIKDSIDARSTRYYFMPQFPMKKGNAIELLTNYKSEYEEVRVRKGYGKRNVNNGEKSDSECYATFLERNFTDREDVENVIDSVTEFRRFIYLLNSVETDIFSPLIIKAIDGKLDKLQLLALRRIHWLFRVFRKKIQNDSKSHVGNYLFKYYEYKINVIIQAMELKYETIALPVYKHYYINGDADMKDALLSELLEEKCFELRQKLPRVMDTSIYCPIARQLIKSICLSIEATLTFRDSGTIDESLLEQMLVNHAMIAKKELFEGIQSGNLKGLEFSSGLGRAFFLIGASKELMSLAISCGALSVKSTTISKGIVAAILEKLETSNPIVDISDQIVMVSCSKFIDNDDFKDLGAIPMKTSRVSGTGSSGVEIVNVEWYLLTQVIYVIDVFASVYLANYSLKNLCKHLGVNFLLAETVTKLGMTTVNNKLFEKFLTPAAEKDIRNTGNHFDGNSDEVLVPKCSKVTKPPKDSNKPKENIAARPPPTLEYEGPPTTKFPAEGDWPPGWTQKSYKRGSGASKGHIDHYWFPPEGKPKLRSYVEILTYLVKKE